MNEYEILSQDTQQNKNVGLRLKDLHNQVIPLNELFTIPEEYCLTESTARYYGSLTPPIEVIKRMKNISYTVTFDQYSQHGINLGYENPINTHLYKPQFFANSMDDTDVQCIVPCEEVLAHSLRSLAVFSNDIKKEPIAVEVIDNRKPYEEYCTDWDISDNVIFCWRESYLKFLRVHWLLEQGVDQNLVEELVCEIENRLKIPDAKAMETLRTKIKTAHGINLDDFEEAYNIRHQMSDAPCIASSIFTYNNHDITLVQLSWGMSLSKEIAQMILNKNASVQKIGSAGGVGYARNDFLGLDDIFLPEGIVKTDNNGRFYQEQFDNKIFGVRDNQYFHDKNIGIGDMKTITPTIGVLSNTATFKDQIDLITGFDMELEGFRDILEKYPEIQHAAAHYIMDLPFRGISLGDTYYNKPYLEQFFRLFNRGKYYCFEKLLSFMASD